MKFFLAYPLILVILLINDALSIPLSDDKNICDHQKLNKGKQDPKGTCSTTIQGEIPSVDNMVATIITSPDNNKVLKAKVPFKVSFLVGNLATGFFSDPDTQYYTLPQTLNKHGLIKGHVHVTIQSINENRLPNTKDFVFFKGVNDKADKHGRLSVEVENGLSPGRFRICTISGSFSHQPPLLPIAKRGAADDCIRITVEKYKGKDAPLENGENVSVKAPVVNSENVPVNVLAKNGKNKRAMSGKI
ncbi:3970_t:CDS:1 [Funneliformis caledonium]|uniref:3970_t:CDS:1 n=1 Tax=Funneliformis caledonium TaxID=1117310 RepID=A0A9N9GYK7_9GLOM|nr:3970_t:CDS:1 [Funneliformis caledonium]